MARVAVYDKRTGRKHSVPEHWLDHPVLGRNLSRTPKSMKSKDDTPTAPSGDDKKEIHNAPRPR